MSRYIDADLLYKELEQGIAVAEEQLKFAVGGDFAVRSMYVTEILERENLLRLVYLMPTSDVVEVRHGEWIEGRSLEKCSLCGKKGFSDWLYCPCCGAKMDGERRAEQCEKD